MEELTRFTSSINKHQRAHARLVQQVNEKPRVHVKPFLAKFQSAITIPITYDDSKLVIIFSAHPLSEVIFDISFLCKSEAYSKCSSKWKMVRLNRCLSKRIIETANAKASERKIENARSNIATTNQLTLISLHHHCAHGIAFPRNAI